MSMLAEPRRKKRTINLRTNNEWSKDQNKFGQKLMEKMGWAPGKGLGVKEDGNTDHVKVKFKDDAGGVGYKDKNDQWTAHEANFNGLLQALHGGAVDTTKLHSETSLEEKSKNIQSRLHYKKFTRGKDITKYSEKDLANIFGKKSLKPVADPVPEKIEEPEVENSTEDNYDLVTAGSMADYFKNKMNGYKINITKAEDSDKDDGEVGFKGFSDAQNGGSMTSFSFYPPPEEPTVQTENLVTETEIKIKKKKKKNKVDPEPIDSTPCEQDQIVKKKKVKNTADLELEQNITCEQEEIVMKKKKKKNKSNGETSDDLKENNEENCETVNTEIDEEKIKTKRKKSKKTKTIEEVLVDTEEICDVDETRQMSDKSEDSCEVNIGLKRKAACENSPKRKCNKSSNLDMERIKKLVKASNTWELEQIVKMLEDPNVTSIRKETLNDRLLELNDSLIKDLLESPDISNLEHLDVLENMVNFTGDEELHIRISIISKALHRNIENEIKRELDTEEIDNVKLREKLNRMLSIAHIFKTEESSYIEKVNELQHSLVKALVKKFKPHSEDCLDLLDEIDEVSKEASLTTKKRADIFNKLFYVAKNAVLKSSMQESKHLCNVLTKLTNLRRIHITEQMRNEVVKKTEEAETKRSTLISDKIKSQLGDDIEQLLKCSVENVLMFEGTNLDFISGYDSSSKHLRSVSIWTTN